MVSVFVLTTYTITPGDYPLEVYFGGATKQNPLSFAKTGKNL